ncbi:MAG TPA: fibronectin type III domain-containing protein, partial [Candidatus Angelobacter sp.]|nr:fibronectin type III domain-containing protein [Candidatus Angelobacter sp.]
APSNPPTAPVGGIVLYGTNINPATGQPVRHLWVGDSNFGLCRVDPDLDTGMASLLANPTAPSPFTITITTCPFKLNGLSVTGGPMAFDPQTNNLYLTDEQTNSEGIFRLGFLPSGDNGEGAINFNNIFAMVGNITGSRFTGGTTGCAFPPDSTESVLVNGVTQAATFGTPNGIALAPDGSLWVGFKKQSGIVRINNPATATSTGFGTCNDFAQVVAAAPAVGGGNGLVFIGHDMWGAQEGGAFKIANADTACQALGPVFPQTPTCGTQAPAVAAFAAIAPVSIYGDQTYPYLNGNNLYFGDPTDVSWVGNVSGGGTIVVDPFEPAGIFALGGVPRVNINAVVADMNDPANVSLFSGDDPTGNAVLAQGRWWFTSQNPSPVALAPGIPTIVRASAVGNTITVSWSPAQNGVPVTSYTVTDSTGVLAPQTVNAPAGGGFPPNFLVIPGVPNGAYAFTVTANNGAGSSAPSAASNTITLPFTRLPSIPTTVSATAGDTVAFVSFAPSPNAATDAITGYLITSTPGGFTATVAANATSGTVTGLTDGTTYTFVVQAINAGGLSMKSTPSNPVTPAVQPKVTIALNGPLTLTTVPAQATFTAVVTNSTATAATIASLKFAITTTDGAAVLGAQTGQGTCGAGSTTATSITCSIGTLAPGASVNVNFIVQVKSNPITSTATFTGTDAAANPISGTTAPLTTATPGAPPQGGPGPTLTVTVTANSAKPSLNDGASTTHTFVATNTGSVTADSLSFTISEPSRLTITKITAVSSAPATDPVTCNAPVAAVVNNQPVNNIVCNIASLGGNLKNGNKPTTAQTITITVNVTGPTSPTGSFNPPLQLAVSSVVAFNGIDAVSPSAGFTQTVK